MHRLLTAALPEMRALADDTRQSNHLVVHHDRRILMLAQVDSPEAMGFWHDLTLSMPDYRRHRSGAWRKPPKITATG